MTKEKLKYFHNHLYATYRNQMTITFVDTDASDFGSYLKSRRVVLPECIRKNPSEWSLFAFLHEIGHIMTNEVNQYRCVQEYLATQWAIDKSKEIGFHVPQDFLNKYQEYIFKWYESCIKRNAKNAPSKDKLLLKI